MGLGRLTGAEQQQNAARRANAATQEGIAQGRQQIGAASPLIRQDIQGGINQNLGFLDQARDQLGSAAGAFDPALANLQATSTAGGRSQALADILADPNNAAVFDELNRTSQNELSGLGARRSGFGIGQTQQGQLGLAQSLLGQQDMAQQNLANIGMGANTNIANLFGQSGGVAGQGGLNLANQRSNELAQMLNLTGQSAQSNAANFLGRGNAAASGMGSLLSLGGQLGGAAIGRM